MQQKEREKQRMLRSATSQGEPNLGSAETTCNLHN